MWDLLHYLQALSTRNHCFVPHQTFWRSANSGQFQDWKLLLWVWLQGDSVFGKEYRQFSSNHILTWHLKSTQRNSRLNGNPYPAKYNRKTYNSQSTNYCSNVPFALCNYYYTALSLLHSTCNHVQCRWYPYIIIVHAPNFASILTKVKFQECYVMKIKVNGMDTFLGDSTFEFITVILNFFFICTLFKEHKNTQCAKLGIIYFQSCPYRLFHKKRPKMCLT